MTDWTQFYTNGCSSTGYTSCYPDDSITATTTVYLELPQWKAKASTRKKYFPIWHLMESYK